MSIRMNRGIEALRPYQVSTGAALSLGSKASYLKLDWNEAAWPPSPGVAEAIAKYMDLGEPNHYPDVNATELRQELSDYVHLPVSHIRAFNGSDAALRDLCAAFLNPGDVVVIREPTYTQMRTFIAAQGARANPFLASGPFELDQWPLSEAIQAREASMVYIANPNNPTGVLYHAAMIGYLCQIYPNTLFVVDEAYHEFCGFTSARLVEAHRNLAVIRTFSKAFGLAGLRLGYLLAGATVMQGIDKVRNGKEVNTLAQVAGVAALDDLDYVWNRVAETREVQRETAEALRAMGLQVVTTPANFLLVKVDEPRRVMNHLKAGSVLVRDRSTLPQLEGYLRVTVGTTEQMARFVDVMGAACGL